LTYPTRKCPNSPFFDQWKPCHGLQVYVLQRKQDPIPGRQSWHNGDYKYLDINILLHLKDFKMKTNKKGFSLVEVLIAAAIISLSMFAIVGMVRKSQELTSIDQQRRVAKFVIAKNLESVMFQQISFPNLQAIQGTTLSQQIKMDSLPGRALYGNLETRVGSVDSIRGNGGVFIPFIDVESSVIWTVFPENTEEKITIVKRISPL
jgi:prepilin-type N-terminal cleavage/methylation domain-containing protein